MGTGGTGYLGRAIVAALLRHGHQPTVFARRARAAADLAVPRIDGDVRDRDALLAAARGMDGVIHTAALVSVWQDRADFDRVNVGGLETVVDVCAALGIPRRWSPRRFWRFRRPGAGGLSKRNDYQRSKGTGAGRSGERPSPAVCRSCR